MSSKHTPGPWMVWSDGHGNLSVRSANERDTADATYLEIATEVGGLRTGPNFKDHSEEQANARLIAAAPELLAIVARALRDGEQSHFEDWLERTCPSGDVESVKRQWLGSSDYVLFSNVYREELAVLDKIEGNT